MKKIIINQQCTPLKKIVLIAAGGVLFCLIGTPLFAQTAGEKGWVITTTDTSSNHTPAYLANGIVGIRSDRTGLQPVSVHLQGLYDRSANPNAMLTKFDYNPRLVNEYNPLQVSIVFRDGKDLAFDNNVRHWKQTWNLKEALLTTEYEYGNQLMVKTELAALRQLPVAAITTYVLTAMDDVAFTIQNNVNIPDRSSITSVHKPLLYYRMYKLSAQLPDTLPIISSRFPTLSGTDAVSGSNTFYFNGRMPVLVYKKSADSLSHSLSFTVKLKKGESYRFCMLSTFQHTGLTVDPYNDAIRISSREYHRGYLPKLEEHKARWAELWKGDVEIDGDDDAQINARLGMYCLYSSITEGLGYSIPCIGLFNEWGAHIFWDAEVWMYPGLLVLQPQFAASMMDFRYNTLPQAKRRAVQFGYKGAMYPWESDLSGNEGTSTQYKLDMTEHHITADIAIAAWNYYSITGDQNWLKAKGWPMIKPIADFWVSRATRDAAGKYHINDVVGSDEYAEDINDDAFTNGVAKLALANATKAAIVLKEPVNPLWKTVADALVILEKDGYTLQNQTYHGQQIKQADVNLLAFPYEVITDKTRILNDLEYYQSKINPVGPSMSYSVLAGAYARIGKTDKAFELFQKAYKPNLKAPFGIFSERPTNNITPFCTGYGGILQTILFGFGGLRIRDTGLVQGKPSLPAHWKKLTIKRSGKKDIVCTH